MNEKEAEIFNACESGDIEAVKRLIDENPKCVHARDKFLFTPLQAVASTDLIEIAELLLTSGAEINAKNSQGISALHIANYPEMTKCLIDRGADLNAVSNQGDSPLITLAGEQDGFDSMEVLLEAGADPEIKNAAGKTAFDIAKAREETDKVELLMTFLI